MRCLCLHMYTCIHMHMQIDASSPLLPLIHSNNPEEFLECLTISITFVARDAVYRQVCVCVCVCVCVYVYVCMYACDIGICMYVCMFMHVRVYMNMYLYEHFFFTYVCMCVCMCVCARARVCIDMYRGRVASVCAWEFGYV